jgi:hypothetical protein
VKEPPEIRYARSEDGTSIAYSVAGDGPFDLLFISGFVSHIESSGKSREPTASLAASRRSRG